MAARSGGRHDRASRRGVVVPSCDAFFLHVETTGAVQHVGGLVLFEPAGDDEVLSVERVRDLVRDELERLPRFRQRLVPATRWRRARWVDVPAIDWASHISVLRCQDGRDGLRRIVADLAEIPMPRDRPLWRIVLVRDAGPAQYSSPGRPRQTAMILLLHHSVADGNGIVMQALNLLRPRIELPSPPAPAPGRARLAAATIVGLGQLATDGRAGGQVASSARRDFATADFDLDAVRRAASARQVRVTDLVLALVADAVAHTHPELSTRLGGRLRVAIPQTVRGPGTAAETNGTAGVMVNLPIDGLPIEELIAEVGRRTGCLRTPSRAVASRFVVATGLRALPEPAAAWFARTVYGHRFLHGIVSNMRGPTASLSMAGVPIARVYPILPLAPGAPLALGALSWAGSLGVGLATDPATLDAAALTTRLELTLNQLMAGRPVS